MTYDTTESPPNRSAQADIDAGHAIAQDLSTLPMSPHPLSQAVEPVAEWECGNGPDIIDVLVTCVSWEQRFLLGFSRLLRGRMIRRVVFLLFSDHEADTAGPLASAQHVCDVASIDYSVVRLSYSQPDSSWRALRLALLSRELEGAPVLVDITTMPRETIWLVLGFLDGSRALIWYAYHRPGRYSDWLSRDPQRPRLTLQHSGIAQLGRETVLLVTTGFDVDRTQQLLRTYEPRYMLLGMQAGAQYENEKLNREKHEPLLNLDVADSNRLMPFEVDAYSDDHGEAVMLAQLTPHRNSSNIIMTSLGPKLSAVAMYRINRQWPDTALSYVPSGQFNREYSYDIRTTILRPL